MFPNVTSGVSDRFFSLVQILLCDQYFYANIPKQQFASLLFPRPLVGLVFQFGKREADNFHLRELAFGAVLPVVVRTLQQLYPLDAPI